MIDFSSSYVSMIIYVISIMLMMILLPSSRLIINGVFSRAVEK